MKAKLTKRTVDAAQPDPKRRLYLWDAELKGFGLVVTPKGVKTYIVQYRAGTGRLAPDRKVTLGRHGTLTPEEARNLAKDILAGVRHGGDPAAERSAQRQRAATVADLADRYLEQHVDVKNKASTAAEWRRIIERHVKPKLGRLAIEKVQRADVAKVHHDMRSTPRQANLTIAVLSKMFSLAEVWGLRPDHSSPCRGIEKYKEAKRERFLSEAELAALGAALVDSESVEMRVVLDAVRLLLLTGCRLGEVVALRWDDVSTSSLVIRDAKAGARVHAIGAQTAAFLAELRREGEWVLPGTDPKRPLSKSTLEHAWTRIRSKASLDDVRLHDLRHTVGTYAGQTGANAFLVRDKLGHKTLAMTARYVNRDADPLRDLSDKVESRISAALTAGEKSANVVPIATRGA